MMKKYIFAFLFCCLLAWPAAAKKGVEIFEETRDLPSRPVIDAAGKRHKLSEYNGQFVILVFWSKNCVPCIRELDDLNNFYKNNKNILKLLVISPEEEWDNAEDQRQFLTGRNASDLDFYTDPKGSLAGAFGIYSTPHAVLINRNNKEIGRLRGSADWDSKKVSDYIYKIIAENG